MASSKLFRSSADRLFLRSRFSRLKPFFSLSFSSISASSKGVRNLQIAGFIYVLPEENKKKHRDTLQSSRCFSLLFCFRFMIIIYFRQLYAPMQTCFFCCFPRSGPLMARDFPAENTDTLSASIPSAAYINNFLPQEKVLPGLNITDRSIYGKRTSAQKVHKL